MRRLSATLALSAAISALGLLAACKPGDVGAVQELCARAATMYDRCEDHGDVKGQAWEIVLDRWRGLCRASITGETDQLLPNARALWNELPDDLRAGLRVQAECGAAATTCEAYRACDQDAEPSAPASGPPARKAPLLVPGG